MKKLTGFGRVRRLRIQNKCGPKVWSTEFGVRAEAMPTDVIKEERVITTHLKSSAVYTALRVRMRAWPTDFRARVIPTDLKSSAAYTALRVRMRA
ncbi:hypothetical protein PoB_007543400 [Plakobranchus ocellatus]|uniref:Uncharacterized protein n=1 Tax=Plakobranchus ocellatus TaxID=259542 RepID=A0AAV4DXY4_9GAST|nr:hypothetical protein PoB_007543400 [Plakobranchus ocellatus]